MLRGKCFSGELFRAQWRPREIRAGHPKAGAWTSGGWAHSQSCPGGRYPVGSEPQACLLLCTLAMLSVTERSHVINVASVLPKVSF